MARNEWINGYLEAILDAGDHSRKIGGNNSAAAAKADAGDEKRESNLFSPTRYFVEEVITSFDESDLHRTWIKVNSRNLNLIFIRGLSVKDGGIKRLIQLKLHGAGHSHKKYP